MFEYFYPNPKTVEEYQNNRHLSQIHSITEWEDLGDKGNYKYYTGERFFKISRRFYPQFTRGYIFGYYEHKEGKAKQREDEEITREF